MKAFNSSYHSQKRSRNYTPLSEWGAALGTAYSTRDLVPNLYEGDSADLRVSGLKGDFLESLQRRMVEVGYFNGQTPLQSLTPHRIGNSGIDGVLFQAQDGKITNLIVLETKYGFSQLNPSTADGRQMSSTWISSRLEKTADMYSAGAQNLQDGDLVQSPIENPEQVLSIPGKAGSNIEVLIKGNQYFTENGLSKEIVIEKLRQVSSVLAEASEGTFPYSSVLLKGKAINGSFTFSVQMLGEDGYPIDLSSYKFNFSDLNTDNKMLFKNSLYNKLVEYGFPTRHADQLVDRIIEKPEFLNALQENPSSGIMDYGPDAVFAGLLAGATSFGMAFLNEWRSGGFQTDHKRLQFNAMLAVGTSATVGSLVGYNIAKGLELSPLGESIVDWSDNFVQDTIFVEELIGTVGGAAAAGASYNIFKYFTGQADEQALRRGLLRSGVKLAASSAATGGTVAAVMALGTAGTGASISGLTGAAAHSATMAWLGGGPVALGGGGMKVGALVLGGVGAVVAIVALGGVSFGYKYLDEQEKQRFLDGKITIALKS